MSVVGMPVTTGATAAPYQCRFVADAGTARAMTRALMTVRGVGRFWFGFVVVLAIGTTLFYDATDMRSGALDRLVTAAGRSVVLVVPVWCVVLAALYLLNLRVMQRRVPEGAVWQSGFEEHDFVVSGPLSSHRYSYQLVRSVIARGDFVFVQLRGNAAMRGYPRALFPDDELARLEHRSAQPGSKARARKAIVLVACVALLGFVVASARVHRDAPDYENAAAIARALHADGIECSYQPLTGAGALRATSAGECTGDHFVVQMYVYATEQQRRDRQATFDRYWCGRGKVSAGGWLTGQRWLIGLAHGTGATTRDLPDLLGATGGDLEPPQCDGQTILDNVR